MNVPETPRDHGPSGILVPDNTAECRPKSLFGRCGARGTTGANVHIEAGFNLADAIQQLRDQLTIARERALGAEVQFPIQSVTVELSLVATKQGEAKAGFMVPVINLELSAGGSYGNEATHKVVIEFGEPVDAQNTPIRVNRVTPRVLD